MVWAYVRPRWVAHTLQQIDGLRVGDGKEVGGAREQDKASAIRSMSATAIYRQLTLGFAQCLAVATVHQCDPRH